MRCVRNKLIKWRAMLIYRRVKRYYPVVKE